MSREPRSRRPRGVGGVRPGRRGCRKPGEIVHALETWEEAAGGGAVAAVQLAKLNGSAHLFTSLGNDELGRRARQELEERGVTVHAASRGRAATAGVHLCRRARRADDHRRSARSSFRRGTTPHCRGRSSRAATAVYFVSGDVAAVRAARRSRVLVAAARDLATLRLAEEEIDVLVGSAEDAGERFEPGDLEPPPRHRRHDLRGARRLGPARWPIPRDAASGSGRGRLRLRRLLRGRTHVWPRRPAGRWTRPSRPAPVAARPF